MRYILDTNAVSEILKGRSNAVEQLKSKNRSAVAIPQPVVSEIDYGIERLPRSKRKTRLERLWHLLMNELPRAEWTDEVSRQFGVIKSRLERRGKIIEDFDIAIAAHALAFEAILITANRSHMERIGELKIEDWTQ